MTIRSWFSSFGFQNVKRKIGEGWIFHICSNTCTVRVYSSSCCSSGSQGQTHTHTYPKAAAWFVWFPGGMVMMTWWQMVGDRGGGVQPWNRIWFHRKLFKDFSLLLITYPTLMWKYLIIYNWICTLFHFRGTFR